MRVLSEKEAELFLERLKFNTASREIIKNEKEISNIIIKFPWVMKVSSKKILHKKRVGGVIININSLNKAQIAFKKFIKIKDSEAVMIQEQISGGEFIIGLKNTQEFKQVLMIGKGGSNVEKDKEVKFIILPTNKKEIKETLLKLNYYKKNIKNINEELLIANIIKILNLIKKYPNIEELDINPLIINKNSASIVDARIVFN